MAENKIDYKTGYTSDLWLISIRLAKAICVKKVQKSANKRHKF